MSLYPSEQMGGGTISISRFDQKSNDSTSYPYAGGNFILPDYITKLTIEKVESLNAYGALTISTLDNTILYRSGGQIGTIATNVSVSIPNGVHTIHIGGEFSATSGIRIFTNVVFS